ncbi:hypothetical protein BDDG_12956 [Blastomyces dermatitidis ATCC 18188]|uniref:Uncharacterized protein n=1 Tax=Ajellomyces dermatitidis (strain ATCC 18188 / CBS 674.68) TaxID=653446 RepID=A0A0J9ERJ5_AJEDA|nr:hypothetical protein BDDG_12956 [Blastomyces dermatitidis ATCC 18188]
MRGLQSVSSLVNVAVSSMPPAAFAWAGVFVILPVVMNAITQDGEAMDGLEFISELLVRCKVREDVIRRRFREPVQGLQSQSESKNLGELHSAIKARTVQLYSDILQYQIQLAIHYDRGFERRYRNSIANGFDKLEESAEQSLSSLKEIEQDIEGISQDSLLKELPRAIFAAFDSSKAQGETTSLHRTCLQGTRIDTPNLVQRWSNALHDYKCIFWLKGMPGTGKLMIARTVAGKLASEGRLGALHHAFIPADGSITRPPAALFVIDALDECEGDDDLREVLPLFSQLRDLRTIKLRVFMTSRPEKLLRSRFSRMPDAYHRDEDLHKIKPSDIQEDKDDITKLFEHELALMREEILLQDNWPGKERVKKLILKPMDYSSTLPQLADFSQRQLQKDWQTYD